MSMGLSDLLNPFLKTPSSGFSLDNIDWTTALPAILGATGAATLFTGGADSALGQFLGLGSQQRPVGYTAPMPTYTAVRAPVSQTYDPNRRPGSGGLRYFSDTQYAAPEQVAAAQAQANTAAQGLAALNAANVAAVTPTNEQIKGTYDMLASRPQWTPQQKTDQVRALMAQRGISPLRLSQATGIPVTNIRKTAGFAGGGYYLGGDTDGMADEVPARIDNHKEAALSDGEFVVPADVVSHLGNGNSTSGAKQLYAMMDRIRTARTGTTEQGKRINPTKFLPR